MACIDDWHEQLGPCIPSEQSTGFSFVLRCLLGFMQGSRLELLCLLGFMGSRLELPRFGHRLGTVEMLGGRSCNHGRHLGFSMPKSSLRSQGHGFS